MSIASRIETDVALAPRTTFELGGHARFLFVARNDADVVEALDWAATQSLKVVVLAGGSNVVIADTGFDGLVIDLQSRGISQQQEGTRIEITAQAGEPWDGLVAHAVSSGLAGLECLSGIPGRVGATPIQNVGAYGQEVADTLVSVRVLEPATGLIHELDAEDCDFGYRHSRFKAEPTRFIVLAATFGLSPSSPAAPRYAELQNALAGFAQPTLEQIRDTVIALRRNKSMVIDLGDPNRRSAGSFFTNPIVHDDDVDAIVERALKASLIQQASDMPTYPAGPGRTKLAAGWLVERAGIHKGLRVGDVGISSRHALSLVHHGGGTTKQLIDLALHVRDTVQQQLGVTLRPEPVFLGFAQPPL